MFGFDFIFVQYQYIVGLAHQVGQSDVCSAHSKCSFPAPNSKCSLAMPKSMCV